MPGVPARHPFTDEAYEAYEAHEAYEVYEAYEVHRMSVLFRHEIMRFSV